MKKKKLYRRGRKFGNWTLSSYLGGGGNGEVWACENAEGETKAIKLLKNIKQKSYSRFKDETFVIEQNSDIKGIIPIIEKNLPENFAEQPPFFIMPVAQSSEDLLKNKSIKEKVEAILQVAETLSELHKRKIYHRDIKPANILFYDSRYSLADFGLVIYPNKREVSLYNEVIGPKWTMAPEMRRASKKVDAAKADIYSLAKTLWIYLTENKLGFDGQYSTESIIHLKKFYPKSYTSPIDNILISCTDNDPIKRPTIEEFIFALHEWKELEENFHERNQQEWFELQSKLFPTSIPQRVIWEDPRDIVKVLKLLCSFDNLNHMFMPDAGGLDLEDVRISYEEGCIELDFQLIHIVRPQRLLFESFDYDHEWNYFRLEAAELEPSGVYEIENSEESSEETRNEETVTEVYPGKYEDYQYIENMEYYEEYDDNYKKPENARHVTRWFRGSFVIFCKRSVYNMTPATYDGRHNKMNTDEFRAYIQRSVDKRKVEEEKRPIFQKLFDKAYQRQKRRRKN